MINLLIMRHAKSSWDNADLTDFERPLNPRGLRDAPIMALQLKKQNLIPEIILSSKARRASETASIIKKTLKISQPISYSGDLYNAEPNDYINAIHLCDDALKTILIIGHNPILEAIVYGLTRERIIMPTATIAHITYAEELFTDISLDGSGCLSNLWKPKDLGNI